MNRVDASEKQEHAAYLKALGAAMKARRKEKGWTLRHMVVTHGFHLSAWHGHEMGSLGMALPTLRRVAKALDLKPWQLLAAAEREMEAASGR